MQKDRGHIQLIKFLNGESSEQQFDINRMETLFDHQQGKLPKPHRHDFYTVIWAEASGGHHLVDFEEYAINAGDIFFISPGQVHRVTTPQRPSGWVITFTRSFLSQNAISTDFLFNINLFRQYGKTPPLVPDAALTEQIRPVVMQMQHNAAQNMPYRFEALGALLKLFLIYCNAACNLERPGTAPDGTWILRGFKKMVEENFRQQHKVKDYAEQLFITPKHLNKVVKELIGCTAKVYIQQRILVEAQRLLRHTDAPIKEVGYTLGFDEPLHFSSFFKKQAGISPTDFRSMPNETS